MRKMDGHENQNSSGQTACGNAAPNAASSYFAILAEDEIGYAIPIENILEFVLLPKTDNGCFVTIGAEKIPCVTLGNVENAPSDSQAVYMICRKNSKEKIALMIGRTCDCQRFFVKTLPILPDDSMESSHRDDICPGVAIYHSIKSHNYQIDVLTFQ